MAVTDLTNTTWKLNNTLLSSIATTYYDIQIDEIHYTQNGVDSVINLRYGAFSGGLDTHSSYYILFVNGDGDNMVYYSAGHYYASGVSGYIENITFTILGGYATTNSTLISWLQNNATQITVSDLTNTTWLLNDTLQRDPIGDFYINFKSNNTNWTKFDAVLLFDDGELYYNEINVYSRGWTLDAFKTIQITGGTDVTNTTLIIWLQTNATQLSVTDLSNTIWVFNDSLNFLNEFEYSINFMSDNTNYNSLSYRFREGDIINYINDNESTLVYYDGWINNSYKTIEIISGTDATNTNLILWLQSNATQQEATKKYKLGWRIKQNSWPGTDLTNTTWVFSSLSGNNITDLSPMSINGVLVDTDVDIPNFKGIRVNSNSQIQFYADFYGSGESSWLTASNYLTPPLTITITGGNDTTNTTLISWLQNNATLQSW